jgi:glucosamine kinase
VRFYAGIDGGQTSTVALIADERHEILGRGVAGPCDHVGQSADSPRFARALEGAIAAALTEASLPSDSAFEAIVAGISGYEGAMHGIKPKLNAKRVVYMHDTRIAHAGAFDLGDGIVVIAGTGSVAYGRVNGSDATIGGWGYLFGDWGSAFHIAAQTLANLMMAEDIGEPPATLIASALQYFERPDLRAIARAFYTGEIDRPQLASFAAELLRLAEAGGKDEGAVPYVDSLALAEFVRICARRLDAEKTAIDVALCGGMFGSAWYRDLVSAGICKLLPDANVVPPRHDPATGALLLAYKEGEGS